MLIRIEPSSSVPIYRQMIDQIRYQVATGVLQAGDKLPSVRELAVRLAVNQNTVLKVYNELCRDDTLHVVRGDGTYVSAETQSLSPAQCQAIVTDLLRPVVTRAVQLGVPAEQAGDLLRAEYDRLQQEREQR